MEDRSERMVWIDLEMTGLDIETCTIIEIATVVTDSNLAIIAEGPNLAIRTDDAALAAMDEWNTSHHSASGLVDRVRASECSMESAQAQTLAFLEQHVDRGVAPLCGNSVWNDKRFLERYMPEVVEFLHYRMIDVSTVKEIARRWYPEIPKHQKRGAHLALDDILESIEELQHYRSLLFK